MSVRAAEAYENGILPASKAARQYGFKDAKTFRSFFRPSEWHHVGKYATPCDFFDVEESVASWERPADVPRGLLRAVSRRMRPWFEERIREMLRENLWGWTPPFRKKAPALTRIADNLARLSSYTSLRNRGIPLSVSFTVPFVSVEAFEALARAVRNKGFSFHDALEMARAFVRAVTENPGVEVEEAAKMAARARQIARANKKNAAPARPAGDADTTTAPTAQG